MVYVISWRRSSRVHQLVSLYTRHYDGICIQYISVSVKKYESRWKGTDGANIQVYQYQSKRGGVIELLFSEPNKLQQTEVYHATNLTSYSRYKGTMFAD
jgi:hypothetical protein